MRAALMIAAIAVTVCSSAAERQSVEEALRKSGCDRQCGAVAAKLRNTEELAESLNNQVDNLREKNADQATQITELRRTVAQLRTQLQQAEEKADPKPAPDDAAARRSQELLDRFRR